MSRTLILMLGGVLLFVPACKKKQSACEKKCEKVATCYQETLGDLDNKAKSVKRCAKICDSKGKSRFKKALDVFGDVPCKAFARRYRAEANFLLREGRAARRKGRPGRKGVAAGDHPFPKLQARPPKDPRKRRTWRSPIQKLVDRVVIRKPKETVELKRIAVGTRPGDVGKWELVKPTRHAADRFAVRNLLNRLERMHFRSKADIKPSDFGRYRVDDKTGVRCTIFAGGKVLADMVVGRADRAGAKGRGGVTTILRKAGTNDVWRVTGSLTYLFKRPASGWQDATVIQFQREDISKLVIQTQQGMLSLKRNPEEKNPRLKFTNWVVVDSKPKLTTLDQNSITRLVSVLTHLRATNIIKDAKPEQTGLDKPRASVTIADKSGKSITLLVGNKDARRRSAFGKLKGEARVFRLRHPLDELPDEPIAAYRDKTLVKAKINQVVGLEVEKDGATVRFVKKGRLWTAEAPAGLKFNQSRLISTIRLLEGRFAAHRFASKVTPAQSGLDKPQGKLRIRVQEKPDAPVQTVEILVGKAGKRGDFHAQVKGDTQVVLIRRWVLNRVWRSAKEWERGPARGRVDRSGKPPSRR